MLESLILSNGLRRSLLIQELLMEAFSQRDEIFLLLQWKGHMMLREECHDEVALGGALPVSRALSQLKQLLLAN